MNKFLKRASFAVSASVASATVFAADHTAAIAAAEGDATLNVTAAATAIIAVVAVIFGVSLLISMFKKA